MEAGYGRMCCQGNPLGRKHESGHWCHGTYGTRLSSRNRWSMEKVATTISSRSPILEGLVRVVGVVTCQSESFEKPTLTQELCNMYPLPPWSWWACACKLVGRECLSMHCYCNQLWGVDRRCILQLQKHMSTQFLPRFQRDVHASQRHTGRACARQLHHRMAQNGRGWPPYNATILWEMSLKQFWKMGSDTIL